MQDILQYKQVDIAYNGRIVVQDVSFSLREGETLGIVGESGSGKSTLVRAAMGLLGSTGLVVRGDILFRDPGRKKDDTGSRKEKSCVNLPDLTNKALRQINGSRIGMIFQDAGSSFCPIRTVGDQLYESMSAHFRISRQECNAKAERMLETIGFENGRRILESYPFELSGGMQQRVGIAAAMLPEPCILLADEPTSALDVAVQKQVVDELLLVRKAFGTAMVIVTHNIGVVRAMADRVLVMKNGRSVEYGHTGQVLENPQEEYTRRLMAAVPRL